MNECSHGPQKYNNKKTSVSMGEREQDSWLNEKRITPRCPSSLSHTHTHTTSHTHTHCPGRGRGHSERQTEQMHRGGQGELINRGGVANNGAFSSPRQDKSTASPRQHRPAFNVNQKDNDAKRPAVTSSYGGRTHTGDATGYLVPPWN